MGLIKAGNLSSSGAGLGCGRIDSEKAMSDLIITLRTDPSYLAAARLLSVLAYPPESASDQDWRKAELTYCRAILFARQQLDPGWADREQMIVPAHLLVPTRRLDEKLGKIMKLNNDRMAAAQVASPFFVEAERLAKSAPASPRREKTLESEILRTISEEEDRVAWLEQRGLEPKARFPKDDHNFARRVFRPSLPVIHIAMATAIMIERSQKALRVDPNALGGTELHDFGGPQMTVNHLINNPANVRALVELAQEAEELIPFLPRIRVPHIVKLRME